MFGKKREVTFENRTFDQLADQKFTLSCLQELIGLSGEEADAIETAMKCMDGIMRAMANRGKVDFDK